MERSQRGTERKRRDYLAAAKIHGACLEFERGDPSYNKIFQDLERDERQRPPA